MDFKTFWVLNSKKWFSKDHLFDLYIKSTYGHLLDNMSSEFDFITQILIFDQLPRHIFRYGDNAHVIEYFLQKALDIVTKNLKNITTLTDREWIFCMLPIRHSKNVDSILKVIQLAWKRLDNVNQDDPIWIKKFLRASYSQLQTVTTTNLITGTFIGDPNFANILDKTELTSEYNIKKRIETSQVPLIISLSGGVDSMVCLNLLKNATRGIVAVHINYCNRDTSYREAEFVNWWCNKHGIKLYTRPQAAYN
jgi:uncharacterized protein (DUF924 family)